MGLTANSLPQPAGSSAALNNLPTKTQTQTVICKPTQTPLKAMTCEPQSFACQKVRGCASCEACANFYHTMDSGGLQEKAPKQHCTRSVNALLPSSGTRFHMCPAFVSLRDRPPTSYMRSSCGWILCCASFTRGLVSKGVPG